MDKKGQKWTVADTLFWLGAALISGAGALLNVSLGMVVSGGFCLFAWFLIDHSGGESK